MTAARPPVDARFICGPAGPLAALVWRPPPGERARFAVLHVQACGDELNKSRRMVAVQARALARRGGIVAVVDLRGTADSAGEHVDATWSGWRDDVVCAWSWLGTLRGSLPAALWGLRLGSLLASELAASARILPAALLLWQPVTAGRVFFTQWLRVASTQQLDGRGDGVADGKTLRRALADGRPIEIAGYELNPELVHGAEAIDLAALAPPRCPVLWRETTVASEPVISPAAEKVRAAWHSDHPLLDFAAVPGPSFWASQEIAEAPELVGATTDSLVDCLAGLVSID